MDIEGREWRAAWPTDPLGEELWDLNADPRARLVEPPRVDPALFHTPDEDHDELEALWEASLSPTAIMARARAERTDALVAELQEIDAQQARLEARKAIVLAALTSAVGGSSENPVHRLDAPSVAASELAAALRISQRTAKAAVGEALTVTARAWAPLLDRMASGDLPSRRANAILEAASPVPPERLAAFAAQAIRISCPPDPDQIPSQGALRRRLRRLAEDHAGEPLARKDRASAHRRVDLEPAQDGMCWLTAHLPLEVGASIDTRLEAIARSLQSPGEDRTISQLRADAFSDLLTDTACFRVDANVAEGAPVLAGPVGGVRTELIVTVPARTLSGETDAPGEIVGYGAINADAARLLASEASTWTQLSVDAGTGAPLAIGRRRYTPTLAMRRFLGARDRTCRFPGCDKPAAAAEADHTREWSEGGATDTSNLALLCPEHHRLKSLGHWKVRQIGAGPGAETGQAAFTGSAHGEPAHGEPAHGDPAHGESAHGDPAHGESAHGDPAHGESAHGDPAHGESAHGDPAHGESAHGDPAHGEPAHGEPARRNAPSTDASSPPGTLEWTAPSGRRYITYPEGDAPPPF